MANAPLPIFKNERNSTFRLIALKVHISHSDISSLTLGSSYYRGIVKYKQVKNIIIIETKIVINLR